MTPATNLATLFDGRNQAFTVKKYCIKYSMTLLPDTIYSVQRLCNRPIHTSDDPETVGN